VSPQRQEFTPILVLWQHSQIAFIIKINQLPTSIIPNNQDQICNAVEDQDVAMFMDDTTLSEVINVSDHLGGISIGNTQMNVDKVVWR
jgi:hypothetical protein